MTTIPKGIRFLNGKTDILIVAPHGPVIDGVYQNDLRTGVIAEEIQRRLGCSAVINDRFFKPKGAITKNAALYFLDLFRRNHRNGVEAMSLREVEARISSRFFALSAIKNRPIHSRPPSKTDGPKIP